jgi:hypothetical protein
VISSTAEARINRGRCVRIGMRHLLSWWQTRPWARTTVQSILLKSGGEYIRADCLSQWIT